MSYEQSAYLVYQGPLGLIVCTAGHHQQSTDGSSEYTNWGTHFCQRASFFASRDGFPVGIYSTFEEAMEALRWKARAKAK